MTLDLEQLEALTLAEDREPGLAKLIPGTPEYYFQRALAHQVRGELDEAATLLDAWRKRSQANAQMRELETRQLLLSYPTKPKAVLDELRIRLDASFDHQREAEAARRELPTALPPETFAYESYMREARRAPARDFIARFSGHALERLCERDDLSEAQLQALLERLRRPDYPRLVDHVARQLASKHSGGFGSIPVHGLMTLAQLDALAVERPRLREDSNFVQAYLARLAPGPAHDLRTDLAAMDTHLDRLWAFVEPLADAFNTLKVHVLYHRLDFDRRRGLYPRAHFDRYLRLPRQASNLAPVFRKRHENKLAKFGTSFAPSTGLETVRNDDQLVGDYLAHFFAKPDQLDYAPFEPYLDSNYLRTSFAQTKLLTGKGDRERWYSLLGNPATHAALERRVDLDLAIDNPRYVNADAPIELAVYVKNIARLVVKVFEINTEAYFQAHQREVGTDIDLDGLVASNERSIDYDEAALHRVRRSLQFEELARPGTFVIELIGGGKSSRALVRKGRLEVLDRITSAGHALTLIDERGQPQREASVRFGGREFLADETGEIRIPFRAHGSASAKMLLRSGARTRVVDFTPQTESYRLDAHFHVPREQLIAGGQATLIVRATLAVAGCPISPTLLEEVKLTLTAQTRNEVRTSTTVALELDDDHEACHTFKVPDDLQGLEFELAAKVRQLSGQRDISLHQRGALQINLIDRTTATTALHLARVEQGYQLWALGKSGEPRQGLQVNLTARHIDFQQRMTIVARTDARGCVELGPLDDIVEFRGSSSAESSANWVLPRARPSLPHVLHIAAHEVLYLPRVDDDPRPLRSLIEHRGHRPVNVRSCLDAVTLEPGQLRIAGLDPGTYALEFADGHHMSLCVGGPATVAGWAISPTRRLELHTSRPPAITRLELGEHELCVALDGADEQTRVHVFASTFLPPVTAYDALALAARRSPANLPVTPTPSQYLSGRDIGEEYRYILERRRGERFPGNMLERPSLLLNPWELRKTSSSKREAKGGASYDAMDAAPAMAPAPRSRSAAATSLADSPTPNLDFLARPATARLNLVPDAEGRVRIPREALAGQQFVECVVASPGGLSSRQLALPASELAPRDLRLRRGLDPAQHFVKRKRFDPLATASELVFEDRRTTTFELVDTLDKALALLVSLSENERLREFDFIVRWPTLAAERQSELYAKYACHELSLFLSRKDPRFFAEVIAPYLANKRERTFIDRYLLGEDLAPYLETWAYGRLNTLERCLLAGRIASEADPCARHIRERVELLPPDPEQDNAAFDVALNSNSLDADAGDVLGGDRGDDDDDGEVLAELAEPEEELSLGFGGARGGGGPPPPPQAPRRASARKKRKAAGPGSTGGRARRDERAREDLRALYRPADKTSEWAETHYDRQRLASQGPELIEPNAFWRDYAAHLAGPGEAPFLSGNFIHASKNFAEMMAALALLDLPFHAQAPQAEVEGTRATLTVSSPQIAFHAQLSPVVVGDEGLHSELLVSQDYFHAEDRREWVDGELREKYVVGEFLIHTVYECRVVVTNPSSRAHKLNLLVQIPRGAMPVANGYETRDVHIYLEPHGIQSIEYSFYFPAPGRFEHYPVHVASGGKGELQTFADARTLDVVAEPSTVDTQSWSHVSQYGTTQELLAYLDSHNIERIELERIAWRMRERSVYDAVLTRLRARHVYDHVLWAYALHHADTPAIAEFLRHEEDFANGCGLELDSPLVQQEPETRGRFQHLEYAPLIHARAHTLGARREIQNEALAEQYRKFLSTLLYRTAPSDDQLLAATYYMLVQDRVAEAIALLARVDPNTLVAKLQYDYLRAYVSLYQGEVDEARRRAEPHRDHPVSRWRQRFVALLDMLAELDGVGPAISDPDNREQAQAKLAAQEPSLELELLGDVVIIGYQALERCTINYYRMDIELLFSRQPFMQDQSQRFSMVQPNERESVTLPAETRELRHPLPEEYRRANAIIEVAGGGLRRTQASFAHALQVRMIEAYGQLRVHARETQAPLPRTYVKVYARLRDGSTGFYKDGYTDLRGAFDYATLSTSNTGAQSVERFAVLVMSGSHGALIREASPPT